MYLNFCLGYIVLSFSLLKLAIDHDMTRSVIFDDSIDNINRKTHQNSSEKVQHINESN